MEDVKDIINWDFDHARVFSLEQIEKLKKVNSLGLSTRSPLSL
jgi:hypothetical protein